MPRSIEPGLKIGSVAGAMVLALTAYLVVLLGFGAASARAADPAANIPLGPLPASCKLEGSSECETFVVARLNAARAQLGLGPYRLPAGFASLSADKQLLILTDLDRAAYNRPTVYGLNATLKGAAEEGVLNRTDPTTPVAEGPWVGFASDWASTGQLIAYYLWMYDDGYGSGNLDCSSPGAPGCWGHRHVILEELTILPQPVLMGAATGQDATGHPGSTLIVSSHGSNATATAYYTWTQAQAEGAGSSGRSGSEGPVGEVGGGGVGHGGGDSEGVGGGTAGASPGGGGTDPIPSGEIVTTMPAPRRSPSSPQTITVTALLNPWQRTASFFFAGEPGEGFECSFVREHTRRTMAHFSVCHSPSRFAQVVRGDYRFEVRESSNRGRKLKLAVTMPVTWAAARCGGARGRSAGARRHAPCPSPRSKPFRVTVSRTV